MGKQQRTSIRKKIMQATGKSLKVDINQLKLQNLIKLESIIRKGLLKKKKKKRDLV